MDAAHIFAKYNLIFLFKLIRKFKKTLIKTIKFKSYPHLLELIKQQEIVVEKFNEIFSAENKITIRLIKS
jgi:hypothetical protein